MTPRCPGQDMRYWTAEDIFDVSCPYCGEEIEFWKDEPVRLCKKCGEEARNPRIDLGCAKWCKFAEACLGRNVEKITAAVPIIEKLRAELAELLGKESAAFAEAENIHRIADLISAGQDTNPCVLKCAALLVPVQGERQREALLEQLDIPDETRAEILASLGEALGASGSIIASILHDARLLHDAQME